LLATLLTAVLAVALLPSCAALAADASGVPPAVPLTTGWQYKPDPQIKGTTMPLGRWESSGGWRGVTIPNVFDARPLAAGFHGTVGWYRVAFTAPARTEGFGYGILFQQVRRFAHVWLNGRDLGTHDDPYVPFRLPASGLRWGRRNMLVVRVDNRKGTEPREGWWNWGGITRSVTLVPRGPVAMEDPGLMSQVDCPENDPGATCKASLIFDGSAVNRTDAMHSDVTVGVTLTPPGGGDPISASQPVRPLGPGESAHIRFAIPIKDPQLWSPDSPKLYSATITTSAGAAAGQVDRMRTGLREISVRNGVLELNGRQLALHGAAIIEDIQGHGPALTDANIKTIVDGLKAVHANITRSHYLLNPKLLDALDAAGIMVWSQAPIYHRDRTLVTPAQRDIALATLRGTVMAARSHPAVITHSVANELSVIPDTVPGTKGYLDAADALVKELDPTLPVSVDLLSYPGYGRQETYAKFDLLGINSYFGWYPGKDNHSTGRLQDLGPFLDNMRRMYPQQALVVTEFGAESTFNGPATQKETYAFQSQYIRDVLKIVATRPFVGGAIYWTLREFAVKPKWDGGANRHVPRDSIHNKGLIKYDGQAKPAFAVARDAYAKLGLFRHVSAAQAEGVPDERHHGLLLAVAAMLAVLFLLAVDGWALTGILRARRASREENDGGGSGEAAPARAA
jgi:beta-glucuronidase